MHAKLVCKQVVRTPQDQLLPAFRRSDNRLHEPRHRQGLHPVSREDQPKAIEKLIYPGPRGRIDKLRRVAGPELTSLLRQLQLY